MKILFIGTVDFSYKALEKLIELNVNIVGVCTKEKSIFNTDFKDLTPLCKENNIEYIYIDNINDKKNIEWMKNKNPDFIFCFGWSSLLGKEILNITDVIGFHPTKLPQNRGRHPIIWALALGLEKSASTFFFMDEGADSGDILSQKEFIIHYNDDAFSLYNKIIQNGLIQIEEFIPQLQSKCFPRIKQDHKKSNYWRKRSLADGKIDFRMASRTIYNLVRALTRPYIGAHIEYKNKNFKVWKVEEVSYDQCNIEFGKVLKSDSNGILVKCFDGAIRILEHDFIILPNEGEYL